VFDILFIVFIRKIPLIYQIAAFGFLAYGGYMLLKCMAFLFLCCFSSRPEVVPVALDWNESEKLRRKSYTKGKLRSDKLQKMDFDPEIFNFNEDCGICLCGFKEGDQITVLPCDPRHYFHSFCIMEWLDGNGIRECPICMNKISLACDENRNYKASYIIQFLTKQGNNDQ
jgi:hypothetical protein